MSASTADLAAVKTRQQAVWASGNYAIVGSRSVIVGEQLCETVDLRSGERVLDVATGSGNTALSAARRFCPTTGIDYVPALLEHARRRAAAEGLDVVFADGDAEAIPVPDASFDVVLSTFGVMFAPDHPRAAAELLRVCRPGGRIGLSNWVHDGFIAEIFATTARHVPPPAGTTPPVSWGDPAHLRQLFGEEVQMSVTRRPLLLRFPSPPFWVDFFATNYGPTRTAFNAVGHTGADALRADLLDAIGRYDVSDDDTLVLRQDYIDVVVSKPRSDAGR
jgi:SAM-dependent methyltransferase